MAQPDGAGTATPDERRVVLVVGPGRSGTSTIAGALVMSGLEVPGKAIQGNETNPAGFYEPRWVVDLHKRLLDRAQVNTLDTSPDAFEAAAAEASGERVRAQVRDWLARRLEEQPRIVVKDPRGIWFTDLWRDAARDLGVEPGFVTMLRHPAEVSASRQTYYANARRRPMSVDDVTRIGGWLNVALTAERVSRGSPRAFVRYPDLVSEWRPSLRTVAERLSLTLDPSPEVTPHPVDDFIDPGLRRHQVDWDDVSVPADLKEIGERAWQALNDLAEGEEGEAAEDSARQVLDEVAEDYQQLTDVALALTRHAVKRRERAARREGARQARRRAEAATRETQQEPAPWRARARRVAARVRRVAR